MKRLLTTGVPWTRRSMRFWGLWASMFAGSVGSVHAARGMVHVVEEVVRPSEVTATVAMPPKPDGASKREGSGTGAFTWEGCEALSGTYADACFAGLAWQRAERDPVGALEACAAVLDEIRRQECTADVAEGHALTDRQRAFEICETIPARRWRDQCVFGIALAFSESEPAYAVGVCERAGVWTRFCRHDVNGERAVVDDAAAVSYCEGLAAEDQPSCWHGVGKYIARIDAPRAFEVCGRASTGLDLRGQCVHGVGWAMAETRGAEAVSSCDAIPDERDSCLMGVAYHAKRFEPEAAAELCEQVRDPASARRCGEMVRRKLSVGAAAPVP